MGLIIPPNLPINISAELAAAVCPRGDLSNQQ